MDHVLWFHTAIAELNKEHHKEPFMLNLSVDNLIHPGHSNVQVFKSRQLDSLNDQTLCQGPVQD